MLDHVLLILFCPCLTTFLRVYVFTLAQYFLPRTYWNCLAFLPLLQVRLPLLCHWKVCSFVQILSLKSEYLFWMLSQTSVALAFKSSLALVAVFVGLFFFPSEGNLISALATLWSLPICTLSITLIYLAYLRICSKFRFWCQISMLTSVPFFFFFFFVRRMYLWYWLIELRQNRLAFVFYYFMSLFLTEVPLSIGLPFFNHRPKETVKA